MNFGVPYMGSKNRIAAQLIARLPPADCFVDLFAGGCAMTHAALVSGRYRRAIVNDIDPLPVQLFIDAISGKLQDGKRVISKEDFEALKDIDPYVRYCWSFGNNGREYLWNSETAGAKILACKMVMADDYRDRHRAYRGFIKYLQDAKKRLEKRRENLERYRREYGDIAASVREQLCKYRDAAGAKNADIDKLLGTNGMAGHYFYASQWQFPTESAYNKIRAAYPNFPPYDYWGERLESLESLESLERLERLQSLERLEAARGIADRIERHCGSYTEVPIPPGATVYCDPPYRGTNEYCAGGFDSDAFFEWALSRNSPVYVSEYSAPDGFACIAEIAKTCGYSATGTKKTVEKLFVQKRFAVSQPEQGEMFE